MIAMTIRDGLGARIMTMANGLSTGQEVAFGWDVNEHCPLGHEVVFPKGLAGVHFVAPMGNGGLTDWNAQPYFAWAGAKNRRLANAAYARIMRAMAGTARRGGYVGVMGRFLRNPQGRPATLAAEAVQTACRVGASRVFLMCDHHREMISEICQFAGLDVECAKCSPLVTDLERHTLDTRLFLDDWKTLLACKVIVAIDGATCLLNPARAAGREIVYTP